MQNNDLLLIASICILLLGVALLLRRRGIASRKRLERAQRAAMREDLGGDSYFMPPPPIAEAVVLDDPVEIDSLLEGESETVAAQARRQLERNTDTDFGGLHGLSVALGGPAPPPPPPPRPVPRAPAPPPAPIPVALRQTAGNGAASAPSAPAEDDAVPVRELVLAWFEARGYRPALLLPGSHPLELLLRHRTTPARAYAFVVERVPVTAQRATSLLALARTTGLNRLLIAAEAGAESGLAKAVRSQGIRIYDEEDILAALRGVDIRIAAKIIALARRRAVVRAAAQAGAAPAAATPRATTAS